MTALAPDPAHLRDEIARLSEMIGIARQLVAMGGSLDLQPVGEGVHALCHAVAMLPHEQGVGLREELEALSLRLDRLGTDLSARVAANDQPETATPAP